VGDSLHRVVGVPEPQRGEVHPPPGQVAARRLAGDGEEAPRQRGARHRHLGRERLGRPRPAGRLVQPAEPAPTAAWAATSRASWSSAAPARSTRPLGPRAGRPARCRGAAARQHRPGVGGRGGRRRRRRLDLVKQRRHRDHHQPHHRRTRRRPPGDGDPLLRDAQRRTRLRARPRGQRRWGHPQRAVGGVMGQGRRGGRHGHARGDGPASPTCSSPWSASSKRQASRSTTAAGSCARTSPSRPTETRAVRRGAERIQRLGRRVGPGDRSDERPGGGLQASATRRCSTPRRRGGAPTPAAATGRRW